MVSLGGAWIGDSGFAPAAGTSANLAASRPVQRDPHRFLGEILLRPRIGFRPANLGATGWGHKITQVESQGCSTTLASVQSGSAMAIRIDWTRIVSVTLVTHLGSVELEGPIDVAEPGRMSTPHTNWYVVADEYTNAQRIFSAMHDLYEECSLAESTGY
jgi:hypothetical protein